MLTLLFLSNIICYMPGPWNNAFFARSESPATIHVTSLPRQVFHRAQGCPPGPHDDMPCGVWEFSSQRPAHFRCEELVRSFGRCFTPPRIRAIRTLVVCAGDAWSHRTAHWNTSAQIRYSLSPRIEFSDRRCLFRKGSLVSDLT